MNTEKELLDLLAEKNINAYRLSDKIQAENLIVLDDIEELIRFAHNNNIDTMFYYYLYLDRKSLIIDEDIIRSAYIDKEVLPILQEEFDKYNNRLLEIDFSNPISLDIYCTYQGMVLTVEQFNTSYLEQGVYLPDEVCKSIIQKHLEVIKLKREEKRGSIEKEREELSQQMLNDEDFHKCTNMSLRKMYGEKVIKNNPDYRKLFYKEHGGWYDISVDDFVEYAWREYKFSNKDTITTEIYGTRNKY